MSREPTSAPSHHGPRRGAWLRMGRLGIVVGAVRPWWILAVLVVVPAWAEEPASTLRAEVALEAFAARGGLGGRVEVTVKQVHEPLRGVLSVFIKAQDDTARGGRRLRQQAVEFAVERDSTHEFVLGRDLVHDLRELAAGDYEVHALVLLEGVDAWEQAEATKALPWPPTLRFKVAGTPWIEAEVSGQGPFEIRVAYDVVNGGEEDQAVDVRERLEVRGAGKVRERDFAFRVRTRVGKPRRVESPWQVDLPEGVYTVRYRFEADGLEPLAGDARFRVRARR